MKSTTHELRIERIFDAPRQLVWNAWTTPELIMQWWGPEHFTSPTCKVDLRVGGKYLFCMRGPDGSDAWTGGTYKEIVPIELIVCNQIFANEFGEKVEPTAYGLDANFPKETDVTITFEEISDKTKLTIRYAVDSESSLGVMRRMHMKEGWESSLNKFAQVVTPSLGKA